MPGRSEEEEGNETGAQVWRAFGMVLPSSELRTPERGQKRVQSALFACELPGGPRDGRCSGATASTGLESGA